VGQRGDCLGFQFEAGQPVGVVGELRGEQLQGHVPAQARIAGTIDLAHAARAERRDDLIRANPSRGGRQRRRPPDG
jgi:hypothetical protein